jgi:hypothetical protein
MSPAAAMCGVELQIGLLGRAEAERARACAPGESEESWE